MRILGRRFFIKDGTPWNYLQGSIFWRDIMVEKETMKKRRKKGDGSITMKENAIQLIKRMGLI